MSKLKDQIRSATLGAKNSFRNIIVDFNGIKIEVRQLSLFARRNYMQQAMDSENKNVDLLKLQVYAIIASCYVPGENEKVFEDTDYDAISDSVTGGYADKIWEAVQELSNFTLDEAKKN